MARLRIVLIGVGINKLHTKEAKRIKFYLLLVVKGKQVFGVLFFPLGFLGALDFALVFLASLSYSFLAQNGESARKHK
jgi:hypothetical protein